MGVKSLVGWVKPTFLLGYVWVMGFATLQPPDDYSKTYHPHLASPVKGEGLLPPPVGGSKRERESFGLADPDMILVPRGVDFNRLDGFWAEARSGGAAKNDEE